MEDDVSSQSGAGGARHVTSFINSLANNMREDPNKLCNMRVCQKRMVILPYKYTS